MSQQKTVKNRKRFAIGFSFPGIIRPRVEAIADILSKSFSRDRILYDYYHEAEFARFDLDVYFQNLYKNDTELVVVFIGHAYNEREWCGVEWHAIRSRQNARDTDSIMLLKLDNGEPGGFYGNVDGSIDISRKTDEEVAELILQRYNSIKSPKSRKRTLKNSRYSELTKHLAGKLAEIKKDHPSFKLMDGDKESFPNGIPMYTIMAANDPNEIKTVGEIVKESWKKKEKNHLMIEGEGGIGKTVTLLSLPDSLVPHKVPSVYVQLHELKSVSENETIEDYIKTKYFSSKETLFQQFLRLADEPWKEGPQVLILLDGFNEIAPDRRYSITQDINRWVDRTGVQVITSSRYDIQTHAPIRGEFSRVVLQPLERDSIIAFLKNLNARLPETESQWELITYPLMLTLYVQTERGFRLNRSEYQSFRQNTNAGAIIWNYLQLEISRYLRDPKEIVACVLAAEFIAPFIAWRMQSDNQFRIDKVLFRELIKQGCKRAYELTEEQFSEHISDVLYEADCSLPGEKVIIRFLKEELRLFVSRGDSYSLMHQQFRDALAAMHLINVSYASSDLPKEWELPVDPYVMSFVSLMATQEETDKLWEKNIYLKTHKDSATINLLELQARKRNYDFSSLNFSRLDLNSISLFPYRTPGSSILRLPHEKALNEGLLISNKTFYPEGHSGKVSCLAITPDGKRCVSGSTDNTLRVWSLDSGRCLLTLKGHTGSISALAISPDGRRCVSGSCDRTIRIWDVESGIVLKVLTGHRYPIHSLAITPDGRRCVSGSTDSTFRIWELESGKCVRTIDGFVESITLTSDGRHFVGESYPNVISLWNLESGERIKKLVGHFDSIKAIDISRDGKRCVSRSRDMTLRIWDVESEKCLSIISENSGFYILAITPDGRRCVCGSKNNILRVWNLESGECIGILEGHKGAINTISITSDSMRCITGARDKTLRVWELDTCRCLKVLEGHEGAIHTIAIAPDERHCISGSDDKTIRIWNLESGMCLRILEGHINYTGILAITPDGKQCVCGSKGDTLRVWDLKSRKCRSNLVGHKNNIRVLAITLDGKRCVSGSDDNTIRYWELESGECLKTLKGHKGSIYSLAITPDGRRCVSGSRDDTLRIWDLESGECSRVIEGHKSLFDTLVFTPDVRLGVSGSWDDALRVWDLESGELVRTIKGYKGSIGILAISPDGRRCVSANQDNTLSLWDLESGRCKRFLEGHKGSISVIVLSPDSKRCVSGAWDDTLRVWDLESGNCLGMLEGHDDCIRSLAITPDGRRCVSGSRDKTLRLWDLKSGKCMNTLEGLEETIQTLSITSDGRRCVGGGVEGTLYEWDLETYHVDTITVLPLSVMGVDFSRSIFTSHKLKETMRQNGAIV